MNTLLNIIANIDDVEEETIKLFSDFVVQKSVIKGEVLQRKGDKHIKAFYIKKGLLRSYTIDENGKEHIFMFAPEKWLITDVELFSPDSSATLYIDALENSEIEIIGETVFNHTDKLSPQVLTNEINKLIKRVNILQKRILMLMSATAKERYLDFVNTYPEITQRVPQRMIASYLGITPEALSKIRGKMKKG